MRGAEGKFTAADIDAIFKQQRGKCAYFGKRSDCLGKITKRTMHRDHIVPVIDGGSNWPSNIQLTCKTCNLRKSAKDPIAFAQECGLLL